MPNIVKVKHGLKENLGNVPLSNDGELLITVDDKTLYMVYNEELLALSSGSGITLEEAKTYVEQNSPNFNQEPVNEAIIERNLHDGRAEIVGANWTEIESPISYSHTSGSTEALAFNFEFEKDKSYYMVLNGTGINAGDNTSVYLSDKPYIGDDSINETIELTFIGQRTFFIKPTINLSYVIIVPKLGYTGTIRLMEIAQIIQENGKDLYIGALGVHSKNSNSLYIGGGNLATTGNHNIGIGENSLKSIISTNNNIAIGDNTLSNGQTLSYNIAIGSRSLQNLSNGSNNIAIGIDVASNLTKGASNIIIGNNVVNNVSGGKFTETNNSIFIGNDITGYNSTLGTNMIVIGNGVTSQLSNAVILGNTSMTKLSCQVTTITALSDTRIKEDIQEVDKKLCVEAVKNLPVTRYKYKNFTGTHIDAHVTGWLADDVEKVFPKSVSKEDRYFPVLDDNGNQIYENEVPKMFLMEDVKDITMTEALPTLWGAVQDLIERIELLERKS